MGMAWDERKNDGLVKVMLVYHGWPAIFYGLAALKVSNDARLGTDVGAVWSESCNTVATLCNRQGGNAESSCNAQRFGEEMVGGLGYFFEAQPKN